MENLYGDNNRRVGSLREQYGEPTGAINEIPPQRDVLQYYPEDNAARMRSTPFRKQNPENPERPYDSTSREIPEGCKSSSSAKYPNYDNHLYAGNVGRVSTGYTRSTSTEYNGKESEKENIYNAYRSSSNAVNSLTSSSASSDSDQYWEEPSKEASTNVMFESKKGKGGHTRNKMTPKNQRTKSPHSFPHEELSNRHVNRVTRSKSKDETFPKTTEHSQLRTSDTKCEKNQTQNCSESFDRPHDLLSCDIPRSYNRPLTPYTSYDDQMCEANADHWVDKFRSSTETDKQTEHKPYQETMRIGRRNFHDTPKVAWNSRPQPSERTGPGTGLMNKTEKRRESQRTRREMKPMNRTVNGYHDDPPEESSDSSDDCTERRNKISPDSRGHNWPAKDRRQYSFNEIDLDQSATRRNETFPDRREQYCPAEDRRRQYSFNETDSDENVTSRRSETYPDRRRQYPLKEDTRQHAFKEAEPNPTPSSRDCSFQYISQSEYDTKSVNTECGNRRTQPPRWENDKTIERSYSETGVDGLCAFESNQEVPINRDHVRNWRESYQVRESKINLKCGNQNKKSFIDEMPYGPQESREATYFKLETEEEHDFRDRKKLLGRRANGNCNERQNDVIQHNHSVKSKPGIQELQNSYGNNEKQAYQRNQYENKQLTSAFSCDYLQPGNGFHEHANFSGRQEPYQDDRCRESNFRRCYNPFFEGNPPYETEGNRYGRFVSNSASETMVKHNWCSTAYDPWKYEKSIGFIASESCTSRNVNKQNADDTVRGTGRVCKTSCESMHCRKDEQEEQADFYLEQISKDSRALHEPNMLALQSTVIDDINIFGTKLSEAILSCHVSLQLFRATYVEWLKTRETTLKILRALGEEIRSGGDWQSSFEGFCTFLKTAGNIAENVLRLTPYGTVAVPVMRVVPSVVEKVGNMIIGIAKGKKKQDSKSLDILQVLQEDIEESSQLKMFALQCEMQFKETEGLLIEFLNAIFSQQMADAVEDMALLNFIIDLNEADPGSDSFFRRIGEAYRKFYTTGRGESSAATWEAFCNIIDRDSSVLNTLQGIDWHFTRSFQNQKEENDLSMCWATISGLVNNTNPKIAEDALRGISTIIRILETQRSYVNANVSRLFSDF